MAYLGWKSGADSRSTADSATMWLYPERSVRRSESRTAQPVCTDATNRSRPGAPVGCTVRSSRWCKSHHQGTQPAGSCLVGQLMNTRQDMRAWHEPIAPSSPRFAPFPWVGPCQRWPTPCCAHCHLARSRRQRMVRHSRSAGRDSSTPENYRNRTLRRRWLAQGRVACQRRQILAGCSSHHRGGRRGQRSVREVWCSASATVVGLEWVRVASPGKVAGTAVLVVKEVLTVAV